MAVRTRFEIEHRPEGFVALAAITWAGAAAPQARGLLRFDPFSTVAEAKAWVREQFSVPSDDWTEADGVWSAERLRGD